MKYLVFALCLCLQAQEALPRLSPELQKKLEARMKRSQEIYEYERLAWIATDLLVEKGPDQKQLGMWVELVAGERRFIFFGRFKNEQDPPQKPDGFAVVYGYWAPVGKPGDVREMNLEKEFKESPEAFKDLPDLAEAASLARMHPSSLGMGWNYSVFREADRTITAYLLPANGESNIIPIGGDFRLTMSSDGKKILNTVALHRSYLKMPIQSPSPDKSKPTGGYHTHTLEEDLPPETDVAVLKLYSENLPHYLLTRIGLFAYSNGELHYLQTAEQLKR